jgi:hypothetical protein
VAFQARNSTPKRSFHRSSRDSCKIDGTVESKYLTQSSDCDLCNIPYRQKHTHLQTLKIWQRRSGFAMTSDILWLHITILLVLLIYGQERIGKAWRMMGFVNLCGLHSFWSRWWQLQDPEGACYDSCGYCLSLEKAERCGSSFETTLLVKPTW